MNMDCFPGGVTSVATDMTHDRCGETTIQYDNGLHDVKGSSPDVEQVEKADETIPKTGLSHDEDDNTQPRRSEPGRHLRIVRLPQRLNDFVMGTSSRTWHYTARLWWHRRSLDAQQRLWLTQTGKQQCSESTIL